MKRYIALFMTFVALMGALAVPASAAGADTDNYIDLLDYGFTNSDGNNYHNFIGELNITPVTPYGQDYNYLLPF